MASDKQRPTMRIFEIMPSDSLSNQFVEAVHCWSLPGIKCDLCGTTWSSTGLAYPRADLSRLAGEEAYRDSSPVSWNRFQELRDAIAPLLPEHAMVLPGTELGPLRGDARGDFGCFVWVNSWTLLLDVKTLETLENCGLKLPPVQAAQLESESDDGIGLLELQIEPRASVSSSCLDGGSVLACSRCGRSGRQMPESPVVARESLPDDIDLFRLTDFSTIILGTERFVNASRDLAQGDLIFREVGTE